MKLWIALCLCLALSLLFSASVTVRADEANDNFDPDAQILSSDFDNVLSELAKFEASKTLATRDDFASTFSQDRDETTFSPMSTVPTVPSERKKQRSRISITDDNDDNADDAAAAAVAEILSASNWVDDEDVILASEEKEEAATTTLDEVEDLALHEDGAEALGFEDIAQEAAVAMVVEEFDPQQQQDESVAAGTRNPQEQLDSFMIIDNDPQTLSQQQQQQQLGEEFDTEQVLTHIPVIEYIIATETAGNGDESGRTLDEESLTSVGSLSTYDDPDEVVAMGAPAGDDASLSEGGLASFDVDDSTVILSSSEANQENFDDVVEQIQDLVASRSVFTGEEQQVLSVDDGDEVVAAGNAEGYTLSSIDDEVRLFEEVAQGVVVGIIDGFNNNNDGHNEENQASTLSDNASNSINDEETLLFEEVAQQVTTELMDSFSSNDNNNDSQEDSANTLSFGNTNNNDNIVTDEERRLFEEVAQQVVSDLIESFSKAQEEEEEEDADGDNEDKSESTTTLGTTLVADEGANLDAISSERVTILSDFTTSVIPTTTQAPATAPSIDGTTTTTTITTATTVAPTTSAPAPTTAPTTTTTAPSSLTLSAATAASPDQCDCILLDQQMFELQKAEDTDCEEWEEDPFAVQAVTSTDANNGPAGNPLAGTTTSQQTPGSPIRKTTMKCGVLCFVGIGAASMLGVVILVAALVAIGFAVRSKTGFRRHSYSFYDQKTSKMKSHFEPLLSGTMEEAEGSALPAPSEVFSDDDMD